MYVPKGSEVRHSQLKSRHWIIKDGKGKVEEVKGVKNNFYFCFFVFFFFFYFFLFLFFFSFFFLFKKEGVIGLYPLMKAGEYFEYESCCPMDTPKGSMKGFFHMVYLDNQEEFTIVVPEYFFDATLHLPSFKDFK